MADEPEEQDSDNVIETLRAENEELKAQAKMWAERDTDHQIRIQVLGDKVKEMDEVNTNVRVLASKLNIENQNLKQAMGVEEPSPLPTPPAKPAKTTKASLKASAAKTKGQ